MKISDLNEDLVHKGQAFMNPDELQHYGVIGMKWGIRRAKKNGVEYSYKSRYQKKLEKRLGNLKAKGAKQKRIAKYERKLEVSKLRDSKIQAYAEKTSTGKAVLQSILTGGAGFIYQRNRAAGLGRIRSYLDAVGDPHYDTSDYRYELNRARKDIRKRNKQSKK